MMMYLAIWISNDTYTQILMGPDNKKLTSRYIFRLVRVKYFGRKKNIVSFSIMHLEFIGYLKAPTLIAWLRNLVIRLHIIDFVGIQMMILCHTWSAVFHTKCNKTSSEPNHLELMDMAIKNLVKDGATNTLLQFQC